LEHQTEALNMNNLESLKYIFNTFTKDEDVGIIATKDAPPKTDLREKIIYIPEKYLNAEIDDANRQILLHLLFHERAHILYTPVSYQMKLANKCSSALKFTVNVLEDIKVDTKTLMEKELKDTNLAKIRYFATRKVIEDNLEAFKKNPLYINVLLHLYLYYCYPDISFDNQAKEIAYKIVKKFGKAINFLRFKKLSIDKEIELAHDILGFLEIEIPKERKKKSKEIVTNTDINKSQLFTEEEKEDLKKIAAVVKAEMDEKQDPSKNLQIVNRTMVNGNVGFEDITNLFRTIYDYRNLRLTKKNEESIEKIKIIPKEVRQKLENGIHLTNELENWFTKDVTNLFETEIIEAEEKKIYLFVDISSSMTPEQIKWAIITVKAFKKNADLDNFELYKFNTRVYKWNKKGDVEEFFKDVGGGTSYSKVEQEINRLNDSDEKLFIILTDMHFYPYELERIDKMIGYNQNIIFLLIRKKLALDQVGKIHIPRLMRYFKKYLSPTFDAYVKNLNEILSIYLKA